MKIFSDCVIKAILDHPYCFIACIIPTTIAASLDMVLMKFGNVLALERKGDVDAGEIFNERATQVNPDFRHNNYTTCTY